MTDLGLSKREIERELSWILRSPPSDPRALTRLFAEALATVIDKNNRRLAEQLGKTSAPDDVEDDF